ncbi:hypothetical protein HWX41_07475 [Bacillus paramycoides]|uniref:hypothetical protein n=1 Tax=Bacillus paramycoides TaxID=2026194 RepID=UPI0015BE40FA|nr:hypothetical protein [Bacillus paramycoides]NWK68953.1 hypothetical protein [Bacillus paramycoides]
MNLELHLDSREAFFLFRMIGMEEVKGFENPYKGYTVEQIDQEWEEVKKNPYRRWSIERNRR